MKVFLSGPMGVGKSAVAAELARRMSVPCVDLDERIEHAAGQSVASIFASLGEVGFRRLERETFDKVCAQQNFVCALGGGAVTQHAIRRRAQFEGRLVTLLASAETISARLSEAERARRPLLTGEKGASRLKDIIEQRADLYRESHDVLDVGGASIEQIADRIVDALRVDRVIVPLGSRSYTVDMGRGVRRRAREVLRDGSSHLLISDSNVAPLWQVQAAEAMGVSELACAVIPAGEASKNIDEVSRLWDAALAAGLDRKGFIVALGGGVVGDMAGFVAATLFRGVRAVQLPTSLLAMVDSSVGGKTGFDHALGKNLIGAFHQPTRVLCDLDFLSTLSKSERISGLAEVFKSAWLDGESAVCSLEKDAELLRAGDLDALGRAVAMSVRLKARVVADDEREGGARQLLNLGHTVGHALEAAGGYASLRHGEAVALGTVIAFRFAEERGFVSEAQVARAIALLDRLGLPTLVHTTAEARPFLHQDKKRSGKNVAFVFPSAPGQTTVHSVALGELEQFLCNNFP